MATYISVPSDFSKVKSKVAFNLTARQLICFGAAAVVGVPLFFVLRDTAGNSGATLGMMSVMLPMFFLAMYQRTGIHLNSRQFVVGMSDIGGAKFRKLIFYLL